MEKYEKKRCDRFFLLCFSDAAAKSASSRAFLNVTSQISKLNPISKLKFSVRRSNANGKKKSKNIQIESAIQNVIILAEAAKEDADDKPEEGPSENGQAEAEKEAKGAEDTSQNRSDVQNEEPKQKRYVKNTSLAVYALRNIPPLSVFFQRDLHSV